MFDKQGVAHPRAVSLAIALALGLSACGGGGGSNVRPTPPPPTAKDITINTNGTVTRADDIGGAGGLIKSGTGTAVLTGTNTYTGGTTIDDGTLQLGDGGTTGSIVGDVANEGSLVFNRSDDVSFDGIVSGSGALAHIGSGTLLLTGANTYSGGTTVSGGILEIAERGALGTGSVTLDGASYNATLQVDKGVSLSNHIIMKGTNAFLNNYGTIGGDVDTAVDGPGGTYAAVVNQEGGSIKANGAAVSLREGMVANSSGSTIEGGTLGVGLSHGGSVVNEDAGSVIRSSEGIAVKITGDRGIVFNQDGGTITGGSTAIYLENGGQITNRSGSTIETTGTATGSCQDTGNCSIFVPTDSDSPHSLSLFNAGTIIGNVQMDALARNSVSLTVGSSIQGDLDMGSNDASALVLNSAADTVQLYSHAVTGTTTFAGHLDKFGEGTWIIDNDELDAVDHTWIEEGGTLQVGAGGTQGSIGQGDINIYDGSLVFDRSDEVGFAGDILNMGEDGNHTSLVQAGDGRLTLTGSVRSLDNITIRSGTLQVGNGGTSGSIDGGVTNDGVLVFDRGDDVTFDGAISGTGSLIQAGTGSLALTGVNTYTGDTTVSAGVLALSGNGSIAKSSDVIIKESGTLDITGIDGGASVVSLDGAGNIDLGSRHLTLTNANGSFMGAIGGSGSLSLVGGKEVLGGANTYTGGTTIGNGATLQIGNGGSTGSIIGDVANNGTLVFDHEDFSMYTGTYSGVISGSGGLVVNGARNRLVLTGDNTYTGGTEIIYGQLKIGDGGTTGSIMGDVSGNGGLLFDRSDNIEFGGSISGPASLYQIGQGTLVLTGTNTYTGGTSVTEGGVLQVGDGGTHGTLGPVHVTIGQHSSLVFDRSDDVVFPGDVMFTQEVGDGTYGSLIQAGTGTLVLTGFQTGTLGAGTIEIQHGTLQLGNGGLLASSHEMVVNIVNNGSLVFDAGNDLALDGTVSGSGSLVKQGAHKLILTAANTYTGGTAINEGILQAAQALPGNATVMAGAELDGYSGIGESSGIPRVADNLSNAGTVSVHDGDSVVGGGYLQASTGTLAVSLGSKLDVTGTATLGGGTLRVTGADSGYVANTHTEVLTAGGGVDGTFDQLVKDAGVVFTATTINYDANSVWLDTTGLDVAKAAKGDGVDYTPASMGSAVRVQGAFEQLNDKVAKGSLDSVASGFVQAAGQFQQSPDLHAAQASLESLSGQLHAASAGMVLQAIDAAGRALSDRLDDEDGPADGQRRTWMRQLNQGGDMARNGFADVDYQLNGWLVGTDVRLGQHALAGFAFSQGSGMEQLAGRFDRNRSLNTEGMVYAGWTGDHWYAQGRVGMGQYRQRINRMVLLGSSYQGVWTQYDGRYNVAYGESGLRFDVGPARLMPFVELEYDRVTRDGFAEQGAGGFGLKAGDQALSRWQSGLGLKLAHQWQFAGGRSLGLDARAQWRRTLSASGAAFDASFVGLDEWRPLTGVGLSRRSAVFGLDLDARPSANTRVKLGYEYLTGDRGRGGAASAHFSLAF
jgi:fibronectin-binding autotransporter adhesin